MYGQGSSIYTVMDSNITMSSGSCIYLILTNKYLCFKHTALTETGLSDFHNLTVRILHCRN